MNPVNSNHVLVSEAIDNVINVFDKIKINMVVIKGINDGEIIPMLGKFLDKNVELRGFGVFSTNIQKARISRNPKTGEKVNTPEKKTIHFKMAKDLFKKLNNEK